MSPSPTGLKAGPSLPFVVAHRSGNNLRRLRAAEELRVPFVEADVHFFRDRVEVRHLKTVGPIPILWDRWQLANPFVPRLVLPELLGALSAETELMLDLKGRDRRLPRRVIDAVRSARLRRVTICARAWRLLEPFRGDERFRVVHSVGNGRQLRRLLRAGSEPLQGVSVHERLLDVGIVEELRRRADLVLTWPVNSVARARELAGWGVAGLISDRPELARELAAAAVGPRA
jgi:hypothetical protein